MSASTGCSSAEHADGPRSLFILKPASRQGQRLGVPVFDGLIAIVGAGVCFYAAWHYERLFESMADNPPEAVVIGGVITAILAAPPRYLPIKAVEMSVKKREPPDMPSRVPK